MPDPEQGVVNFNEGEIAVDANEEFMDIPVDFTEVFKEQYRAPCNIHTCKLFVKDCIEVMPARSKNVLQKAKVICRKQHQSQKLIEATDFVLPSHCETRWNGQLKLLKTIEMNVDAVVAKLGQFILSDKRDVGALTWFLDPCRE